MLNIKKLISVYIIIFSIFTFLYSEDSKTDIGTEVDKGKDVVSNVQSALTMIGTDEERLALLFVDKDLSYFGYDIFKKGGVGFIPMETTPVGPNYILGPGDQLLLGIWGVIEEQKELEVTRDGKVLLPKAGAVYVWGKTFEEASKEIKDALADYYKDFRVDVSMGKLRMIDVFVLGDVQSPGAYTISSLSTILHSLYQAGGPTLKGSLRRIKLIRNNEEVVNFDLYDLIINGDRSKDVRLQSDDVVLVGTVGSRWSIAGYVKKPAIYEGKDESTLIDAIKLSGGLLSSAYIYQVQVERVETSEKNIVLDLNFRNLADLEKRGGDFKLKDGDFIKILPILPTLYNYVTIAGNILRPGDYSLKKDMTVKDLVMEAKGLIPESYMAKGNIFRYLSNRRRDIITFDVEKAMAGDAKENYKLQQWDVVKVYSKYDLFDKPMVRISGEVNAPGTFTFSEGMRVSDLIFLGKELKDTASLEGAELHRVNYDSRNGLEVIAIDLKSVLSDSYNPENQANVRLKKGDILFIRPDINLKFRYRVIVDGEVRYPGEYVIERGESLESVLKRAGGLTGLAYPYGTIFLRQKVQMKQNKILRDTINSELMNIVRDEMRILEKDITEKEKMDYVHTLELRKEILKSVLVNLKPDVDVDVLADRIMKKVKENIVTEKVEVTRIEDLEEEMGNLREKLYILKAKGLKSDKSSEIDEKLRVDFLNRLNTMMSLVSDFKNEFYSDKSKDSGTFEVKEEDVKGLIKNELNSFMELYMSQLDNIDKIEIESKKPDKLMTKLGIQSKLYEDIFPSLYQEGEYFEGLFGKLPISLTGRMVVDIEKDDVKLEDGDLILVTKIPDSVIVTGEVNNPVSIYYEEGKSYKYYLNKAGGLKRNADKKGIYVLKANGSAESRSTGFSKIQRGDIIVAPGRSM